MAKAAIEMGCWGLEAVMRKLPLSVLLGGTRTEVPTGISLGLQETPAALVERAMAAVAAGYQKVKLKIEPGRDVEFVRAVRKAVGPSIELMVDANAAYTIDDATHLSRLDEYGLIMLEQPLGADDLLDHAALQRRLQTPICLDESITDVKRARDMIALAQRPHRQHQAGARRRTRGVEGDSRRLRRRRNSGVVRRNVGERSGASVQRRAGVAPELLAPGRSQSQLALLGDRHRVARVDDGRATAWSTCRAKRRGSASRWTPIASA